MSSRNIFVRISYYKAVHGCKTHPNFQVTILDHYTSYMALSYNGMQVVPTPCCEAVTVVWNRTVCTTLTRLCLLWRWHSIFK